MLFELRRDIDVDRFAILVEILLLENQTQKVAGRVGKRVELVSLLVNVL